jgi:uncharacterized membrane protein YfcA
VRPSADAGTADAVRNTLCVLVVLVALTALAGACLQAATGMGFALVLTPVMFALLSPVGAITAVTLLGLALNILVLFGEGRRPRIAWREVAPILVAVAPGTVCGVLLLRALPKPALQVVVGTVVIVAVGVRVLSAAAATAAGPAGGHSMRLAVGFATGALTTSAGVSGPPLALWLSRCRLGPAQLRDSLSALFLVIGLIALLALAPVLGHAHVHPTLLLLALGAVLAGHAVGSRAFARLNPARFEPLLLLVVGAAGVASLVGGLSAL